MDEVRQRRVGGLDLPDLSTMIEQHALKSSYAPKENKACFVLIILPKNIICRVVRSCGKTVAESFQSTYGCFFYASIQNYMYMDRGYHMKLFIRIQGFAHLGNHRRATPEKK